MLITWSNKIKTFYWGIILFGSVQLFGQESQKTLHSYDTLYIYFKDDKINQIKSNNNIVNQDNHNYFFYFDVESTKVRQYYIFVNHYQLTPEVKFENKSFLKENKKKIINYKILKEMGYQKSEQFLLEKKKIYLIDQDNFCHSKIKIVEVKIADRIGLAPIE